VHIESHQIIDRGEFIQINKDYFRYTSIDTFYDNKFGFNITTIGGKKGTYNMSNKAKENLIGLLLRGGNETRL